MVDNFIARENFQLQGFANFCLQNIGVFDDLKIRMNLMLVLIFYILMWCTLHDIKVLAETGLVFNASVEKLDEISTGDGKKSCPSCVVFCPADSVREHLLNKHFSFAYNSLFSRITYDKDEVAVDVKTNICEAAFKPSMIFDKTTQTYAVGYEIFYKEDEIHLESEKYDEFKGSSKTVEISKKKIFTLIEVDQLPAVEVDHKRNVMFVYPYGRTLIYYWIQVLSFQLKPLMHQIRINLTGNLDVVNNYQSMKECEDYNVGFKVYSKFYSAKKKLYKFSTEMVGSLIRAPLIPMMFLHTKAAKLATCTLFNLIPVWKSIVDGQLKFIDQYVYTIYRHYGSRVNLIFGVSGMQLVQIPTVTRLEVKIIPKIIYRILKYTMPYESEEPESPSWDYYSIIIIHNSIEEVPKEERLCPEPRLFDWNILWNEKNLQAGLSYTCEPNLDLFDKLGAFVTKPAGMIANFHLSMVRLEFDTKMQMLRSEDVRDSIAKEMEEYFGKEQQQG